MLINVWPSTEILHFCACMVYTIKAMKLVDSGYRLPPPPGCSKELYKLMIRCW